MVVKRKAAMTGMEITSLKECFEDMPDPRVQGRCDHKLIDMIMIAVCGVICGAESWMGVETLGKAKQGWLKPFLQLPNGILTYDTFVRVFASLNAEALQQSLSRLVEAQFGMTQR